MTAIPGASLEYFQQIDAGTYQDGRLALDSLPAFFASLVIEKGGNQGNQGI
ncbi:MAG TPA: hypothetical protein VFN13_14055 [Rudaea sp.]|nr:hypothetical protein [Rudaea sp.]